MVKAIVLVNTSPGYMENVLQEIVKIDGVKEAYMLYGVYDIVAIIQAKKTSKLSQVVLKFRRINHVDSTMTMKVLAYMRAHNPQGKMFSSDSPSKNTNEPC